MKTREVTELHQKYQLKKIIIVGIQWEIVSLRTISSWQILDRIDFIITMSAVGYRKIVL